MALYVTVWTHGYDKPDKPAVRENILYRGPYERIEKGAFSEFRGLKTGFAAKDPTSWEDVFEFAVGRGGYCDTCGYEYVSFIVNTDIPYYKPDVEASAVHIEISTKKPKGMK